MPKKNIPYIKIAGGILLIATGYQVGKKLGFFKPKIKKVNCDKSKLSVFTLTDGSTYDFEPNEFVRGLNFRYRGVNYLPNSANSFLRLMAENLTKDDLKCVHNAWLKLIDPYESIYTFLSWQKPYPFTDESELLPKAMQSLINAGLN